MPRPKVTIRAAVAGDASALASLSTFVQELHFGERPDLFKRVDEAGVTQWFTNTLASGHARAWIADVDGGPVGYALVVEHCRPDGPFCYERRWHEVDQLGVHPTHRSLGVARELLDYVVRLAGERGVSSVELNTWSFNTTSHQAFQRCGFVAKNVRFERSTRQ